MLQKEKYLPVQKKNYISFRLKNNRKFHPIHKPKSSGTIWYANVYKDRLIFRCFKYNSATSYKESCSDFYIVKNNKFYCYTKKQIKRYDVYSFFCNIGLSLPIHRRINKAFKTFGIKKHSKYADLNLMFYIYPELVKIKKFLKKYDRYCDIFRDEMFLKLLKDDGFVKFFLNNQKFVKKKPDIESLVINYQLFRKNMGLSTRYYNIDYYSNHDFIFRKFRELLAKYYVGDINKQEIPNHSSFIVIFLNKISLLKIFKISCNKKFTDIIDMSKCLTSDIVDKENALKCLIGQEELYKMYRKELA